MVSLNESMYDCGACHQKRSCFRRQNRKAVEKHGRFSLTWSGECTLCHAKYKNSGLPPPPSATASITALARRAKTWAEDHGEDTSAAGGANGSAVVLLHCTLAFQ